MFWIFKDPVQYKNRLFKMEQIPVYERRNASKLRRWNEA